MKEAVSIAKLAKERIVVIAGEFNILGSDELLKEMEEKLKQGVPEEIYVYNPIPQGKRITKLHSLGAKIFLTKENPKDHYFVADDNILARIAI